MIQAKQMLSTTTNTTGNSISDTRAGGAFQATIMGTGVVSCTVTIQCSLDATNWIDLATISLSGTNIDTDGFSSVGQWPNYRAITSAVTGTVTSITVNMSEET